MIRECGKRWRREFAVAALALSLSGLRPDPARAGNADGIVTILREELQTTWAQCPVALWAAERLANRQLSLELAGKVVLSGSAAPRVEYQAASGRTRLRVTVAASMKSHEVREWHTPDTDPESRHELQRESPGLAATIQVADLHSPLVAIFQAAVELCMGGKK